MSDDPKNLPNENFCIIPWIHLNTWPNGNVFQCCITDYRNHIGTLRKNTLEEIFNNDYMKNLRNDMLQNKQHSSCAKCYEQEEMGITSFRNAANKNFSNHIDDAVEKTKQDGTADFNLVYWDFRFSNLCNMKCRMCGGHLSSLWNIDEKEIYGKASEPEIVVNTKDHSIDDLYQVLDEQIDNVEEIYFAGGEPLIMEEHYYILEKLIEKKRFDVRLRYNTNLLKVQYRKWDNLELWKHFDNVQVIASLDAMSERGEYIRKGTVWNTVDENMKLLIAQDHIKFGVSPTINLFNVHHIPDFVEYMLECGLRIEELHLNNVLTNPSWYHVNILPEDLKDEIRNKYNEHIATTQDADTRRRLSGKYQSILDYLNTDMSEEDLAFNRMKFLEVTQRLDSYRKESLSETFPELASFYGELTQ
jgi:radical SAM protein with 4Fe4S-binding SPASM domain